MRLLMVSVVALLLLTGFTGSESLEVDSQGSSIDYNGDGHPDVTYDYYKEYFYEFIDRNYDLKIDVSNKFNYKDNLPIQTTYDNNFDGYPDTKVFYQNGWVDYSFVDTNKDNKFDVFYSYEYGILKFSEKYVAATNDKSAYIEKIEYELGYPVKTTRVQTSITRDKFQRARSK